MTLPTTGITTTIVKNAIGKNSNNIGDLVASAQSGVLSGQTVTVGSTSEWHLE